MPIETSIDTRNDLILRTLSGAVEAGELLEALEATLHHPDYHPGMKSLNDLRESTHSARVEDIQQVAGLILKHVDRLEGGRAAIVVSSAVSYGMGRMLQAYADDAPLEIAVFFDMAEARRWLGLES
jgi:hypothetical protein